MNALQQMNVHSRHDGFTPYEVVGSRLLNKHEGLGDAYNATAITASAAGAVASTAAALTAATIGGSSAAAAIFGAAAAANVVPVVGQIAAVIAVIAGVLLKVFGKRKQRKAEEKAIRDQIKELKEVGAEIDFERSKVRSQMIDIKNQMLLLGYTDIVESNPIPAEQYAGLGNAKQDLADAKDDFKEYNKVLDGKIKALESDQSTLQAWYDSLTGARKRDNIILGVGASALVISLLLMIPTKKSKKK